MWLSLFKHNTISAWDVQNRWPISLIRISGCRQMKGMWISNIRRHGKHSSLQTDKPVMSASRDDCNGTRSSAIKHFCMEGENLEHLEAHKVCEGCAT